MSTFDGPWPSRRGNSGLLRASGGEEQLFPVIETGLDQACFPYPVSEQKSCVKGGVFFPIQDPSLSGRKVARKTFQPELPDSGVPSLQLLPERSLGHQGARPRQESGNIERRLLASAEGPKRSLGAVGRVHDMHVHVMHGGMVAYSARRAPPIKVAGVQNHPLAGIPVVEVPMGF